MKVHIMKFIEKFKHGKEISEYVRGRGTIKDGGMRKKKMVL